MKIRKKDLFSFFESWLGNSCYIGLHGIADEPDLKNEFSEMSKVEKAENILKLGLINSRKMSIKSTCTIMGILPETYKKHKDLLEDFNNYTAYNTPSKEHIIVIIAVPIVFEDSNNRKIFGGWMNPKIPYNDDESVFECITDQLFEDNIPKEMILGYYSFKENDEEVDFVYNNNFYLFLEQTKRDKFIKDLFDNNDCVYDLNNKDCLIKMQNNIQDQPKTKIRYVKGKSLYSWNISGFSIKNNMIAEAIEFSTKDYNSEFLPYFEVISNVPYTLEEINQIPLEELDLKRVIPNFEIIFRSKYKNIESIINGRYENGNNLCLSTGYYRYNNLNGTEYITLTDFENWIKKYRSDIEQLYEQWYVRNYKEINQEFINELKSLVESRRKK